MVTGCLVINAQAETRPLAGPLSLDRAGVRVPLDTPYVVSRHPTEVCVRAADGGNLRYRHREEGGSVRIDVWGELETDRGAKLALKPASYGGDERLCLVAPGLRWRMRVVAIRLASSEPVAIREVKWLRETR